MDVPRLLRSLLVVIVSTLPSLIQAQNITLGSTLIAGNSSSWLSPSGDFAFGFYNVTADSFLVGIWFDKVPEKTLVWSANRNHTVQVGSTVTLTSGGQLAITDPQGATTLWIYNQTAANSASMQDDGNFVLMNTGSTVVWKSFDSPTDTLLPGQALRPTQALFSNANGTSNYSTGRYRLMLQYDGNLVLHAYHYNEPAYWYTGTLSENNSLIFNRTTKLMYVIYNKTMVHALTDATQVPTPLGDYYHRARLDDYGNFQQFVFFKRNGSNTGNWSSVWRAIDDPCTAYAYCGEYGYCVPDANQRPTCQCIQGFSPIDPSNPFKGCYSHLPTDGCGPNGTTNDFEIVRMDDTDFVNDRNADLGRLDGANAETCENAVREDCFCLVGVLQNGTCEKKRRPLLNGLQGTTARGIIAFVKVYTNTTTTLGDNNRDKESWALKAGLIAASLLVFVFMVLTVCYYCYVRRKKLVKSSSNAVGINLREFTFEELYKATGGFGKQLGRGAFGTVYHGVVVSEGKPNEIAVKQLEKVIDRGEKEFMTELRVIGRTHHKNLVQLLGFCDEGNHRLLVYELMKNGSLSSFLFGDGEKPKWEHRAEIVLGIARGLLYLHEECETQIIHCDIKPQNVLLDDYYTAKISDFGLAKLLLKDQTRTNTNVRGTCGYMAPEWLKRAPVTAKVDVYSFGVMLLEIICCRRHIELEKVEESVDEDFFISDWVLSCMKAGKLQNVVEGDDGALNDFERFERMAAVGLCCVIADPTLRPSMKRVMQMLEGNSKVDVPTLYLGDAHF